MKTLSMALALLAGLGLISCRASRDRSAEPTVAEAEIDLLFLAQQEAENGDEDQLVIITQLDPLETDENGLQLRFDSGISILLKSISDKARSIEVPASIKSKFSDWTQPESKDWFTRSLDQTKAWAGNVKSYTLLKLRDEQGLFLTRWQNWISDTYKSLPAAGDYAKYVSSPIVIAAVGSAVAYGAYKAARVLKSGTKEFGSGNTRAASHINLDKTPTIEMSFAGKNAVSSHFRSLDNSGYLKDTIELSQSVDGKFTTFAKSIGNYEHGTAIIGTVGGGQLLHVQSNSYYQSFKFMIKGSDQRAVLVDPQTRNFVGTVHVKGPSVVFRDGNGKEFLKGDFVGSKIIINARQKMPDGISHDGLVAALFHSAKWFGQT